MDDLDLPPNSPLPNGVRAAALVRVRAGLDAPPPRRLPLKVTAVAVAVVAATTLAVQFTDRGDGTAATTSSRTAIPELRHQDAADLYDLRTGYAPDGAARRCHAQAADLPPAERWTAIATASRFRVDLMAFDTPAGIVFCETTPMSVTVSSPQVDPRILAVAFTTTTGSMAGFTGYDPRPFTLAAQTGTPGKRAVAARTGRLFLMPDGFVSDGVVAQPEVAFTTELAQRYELATPPPTGAVVDRPVTPEDRDSAEGRRLGDCLADQPQPIPDPPAWRAGPKLDMSGIEFAQLGTYGDLLVLCREDRTAAVYDFSRSDAEEWTGRLIKGDTVRGVRTFYRFLHQTRDGTEFVGFDTEALIAVVTDPRVATVTLITPGGLEITGRVVAGGVIVPGLKSDDLGGHAVRLIVKDASGTVLEELPLT
jgi:hypothetical protein